MSHINDVWIVSCHWNAAISGELLMQARIWGNEESWGDDKAKVPLRSGLHAGLFRTALGGPDARFSFVSELCSGPGLGVL